MTDLVDKCTGDFPTHKPAGGITPQGGAVLITGTTDAIGSNTLAEPYKSPNLTEIVILAGKPATPISIRQKKVLEKRGLGSSIFDSSEITLLQGDPASPGFGLEGDA